MARRRAKVKKMKIKSRTAQRRNYGRGYSRRRSRLGKFKWPVIIAAVAIILFVLISITPPFVKLITGQLKEGSSSQISSDMTGSSVTSSDVSSDTSSNPQISNEVNKVVTLPIDMYGSLDDIEDFVKSAKGDSATAVAVTLKDSDGNVYFNNKKAKKLGAVAANSLELEKIVEIITDNGLKPIAVMDTFKDPIAAKDRSYCYLYIDGSSMWLDNSRSHGGKPWLDVNREAATDYLLQLEDEILDAGFKQIMLKSVQYPDVRNSSTIKFPADSTDETKQQALLSFIEAAEERASAKDATITVVYNAASVAGNKDNIYFGSPFSIGAGYISPVIDVTAFGSKVEIGDKTVKKPVENLDKLFEAIIEQSDSNTVITPIIIADSEKIDEIEETVKAVEGLSGYIIIDKMD